MDLFSNIDGSKVLREFFILMAEDETISMLTAMELGVICSLGQYMAFNDYVCIEKANIKKILHLRGIDKPSAVLTSLVEKKCLELDPSTFQVTLPIYDQAVEIYCNTHLTKSGKKRRKREVKRLNGSILIQATIPTDDTVALSIPLQGDKVALICVDYVNELQERFKRLNIKELLDGAAVWAQANPSRRKTESGVRRYLANWILNGRAAHTQLMTVMSAVKSSNGFGSPSGNFEQTTSANETLCNDDFGISIMPKASSKRELSKAACKN